MNYFKGQIFRAQIAGLFSITSLWLITFAVLAALRSAFIEWVPTLTSVSDGSTALSASTFLFTGLGGTVFVAAAKSLAGYSAAAPLLLVPLALFAISKSVQKRVIGPAPASSNFGLHSGLGALVGLWLINFLSVGTQTVAPGAVLNLGFVWVVPAVAAFVIAYAAAPGAANNALFVQIKTTFAPVGAAFRGSVNYVTFVAVLALSYQSLKMGTQLIDSAEFWQWALAFLAAAVVVPSAAAFLMLVALGAGVTYNFLGTSTIINFVEGDYYWVRWVVIGFAWFAVLVSAGRSATVNATDKSLWWKRLLAGAVLGAVASWLVSLRLSGSLGFSFFDGISGTIQAQNAFVVLWFALAGLVHGSLAHPKAASLAKALNVVIAKPTAVVISVLRYIFTLAFIPAISRFKRTIRKAPAFAKALVKYPILIGLVGLAFSAGEPLVQITKPFYDNRDLATISFSNALSTGSTKGITRYTDDKSGRYDAILGSTGLGATNPILIKNEVTEQGDELTKLSWNKGKNFVQIANFRSDKDPFLTVVPQWSAIIVNAKVPSVRLKSGKKNWLHTLEVAGKTYDLNRVLILPGKVEVKAGVDKTRFLKSTSTTIDASDNVVGRVTIALDTKKNDLIFANLNKAMKEEFSGCTKLGFKPFGKAKLGSGTSFSGLPTLSLRATGTCDDGSGPFPYKVTATGVLKSDYSVWTWTYKFD